MTPGQTRRRFLATLSLAGAATLGRVPPAHPAEERLETTVLRLLHKSSICGAPIYVADELLRAEGFTDIRYTKIASSAEVNDAVMHGRADLDAHFAPQWVSAIDGGGGISVLAGVHVGCFELFGNDRVQNIARSQGQECGHQRLGSKRPSVPFGDGCADRARPGPRHPLGDESIAAAGRAVCGGQDRCLPWSPAGAVRPAGTKDRPCRCQQLAGSPVVAIFLLYAGG